MPQRIEGKFAAHDRHHFELKLGYTLNPELSVNKYNIELYLFSPKSLGMNHLTYSKEEFFGDIQGYIRFKTPAFTFDELLNGADQRSPLILIERLLDTAPDRKRLIAELKLFACTMRVALRNSVTQMRRRIRKGDTENLREDLAVTCSSLNKCLSRFRGLATRFENPAIHKDVHTAFRHVDEFICIVVDALLNSFHNTTLDSELNSKLVRELNDMLIPIISEEFEYRKKNDYVIYKKDSENELFLYRKSVLKKIITSILFLNTHTEESLTVAKDLGFAIAAGIAMFIFVALTIWAGQRWSASSIPFATVLVLGYVLKDRIKDWCKLLFSNNMTKWFSDYKTEVVDPATGDKIGTCKHAFSFLTEKKVPREVMRLRRHTTPSDFWLTEDVLKYEKEVILKPGPILRAHARMRDVTDIIRFDVDRFLDRMDEPFETRRALNPGTLETEDFTCARVYHINIVLKLEDHLRRMRLVLDQNGIKRIEEVK